jgi:hypothetical protein
MADSESHPARSGAALFVALTGGRDRARRSPTVARSLRWLWIGLLALSGLVWRGLVLAGLALLSSATALVISSAGFAALARADT